MKKPGIFLIFFFLFSAILHLSAESFISYIEGDVSITRGSDTLKGEFGLPLLKNDIIQTHRDSLAVLEVEGRGILKMRAETTITLDDLGDKMKVSLKAGVYFQKYGKFWDWSMKY
jgi:hypothetical protein